MSRLRGFVWLLAGVVVALLSAFVAFQTLSRAAAQSATPVGSGGPSVTVVTAARTIPVRTLLTAADVAVREVPVESVPEGAVAGLASAEGRLTLSDLVPGEILVAGRLVDPNVVAADGRTALQLVDDEVLVAIPATALLSQLDVLKPGDHVDLFFSLEFPENRAGNDDDKEQQATFDLLQNVTVVALPGLQNAAETAQGAAAGQGALPEALLVTLRPQDALQLKYVLDAGCTLDLALRAPGADQPYDVTPVDVDYLIDRLKIPIGPGQ